MKCVIIDYFKVTFSLDQGSGVRDQQNLRDKGSKFSSRLEPGMTTKLTEKRLNCGDFEQLNWDDRKKEKKKNKL